ncbi:MAG: DUF1963 domain-containing protein [Deltaproteobacteria bacterium]|nr:DUF1963 domain-containing protein [Deltaproteobacteria bacterium]
MDARTLLVKNGNAAVLQTLRPALVLRRSVRAASRLGGAPRAPHGWRWPVADDGRSLSLLAQFELDAQTAAVLELPRAGLLTIFYDSVGAPWLARQDALHVELFAESVTTTVSTPDDCDRFDEVGVALSEAELPRLGVPAPGGIETFCAVQEALDPRQAPLSFLGGHAFPLQEPMEDVCAEVEPSVLAADWRLLLQLDTDRGPGFSWGSGSGRLYVWLPHEDLRRGVFDRVVAIVQDT